MIRQALLAATTCAPTIAAADAWDMYRLCADRSRPTAEVLDRLHSEGWHPMTADFRADPEAPLDPADPLDLSIIATAVDRFFPAELPEAELHREIDRFLAAPYTTYFTAGDFSAFSRGSEIFNVAVEDERRLCRYFGPASASDTRFRTMPAEKLQITPRVVFFILAPGNAHFGSVRYGPSDRLAALLNVDLPDQVHVEVSMELLE